MDTWEKLRQRLEELQARNAKKLDAMGEESSYLQGEQAAFAEVIRCMDILEPKKANYPNN